MKLGSLFTGGGGFDIGAQAAGLDLAWGVEYIPTIAEWANAQLGDHVRCMDILAAAPADFEPVDWLHASPPCPSFSVANSKGGETAQDIAMSAAVARFLAHHRPQYFSLENVYAYRNSESWAVIRGELDRLGYGYSVEHINAADYGVPQKRRRMIVRAERGTFFHLAPMRPTHAEGGAGGLLPWVGWWDAVADLVDTFPPSKLAKWQVERLGMQPGLYQAANVSGAVVRPPHEPVETIIARGDKVTVEMYRAILAAVGGEASKYFQQDDPAQTVSGAHNAGKYRAVLVEGVTGGDRPPTVYQPDEPGPTSTTGAGVRLHRMIDGFRVVALTPRALARFQTFPDWYNLPDKKTLAVTIIGNAVPCLLAQRIVESLIGGTK